MLDHFGIKVMSAMHNVSATVQPTVHPIALSIHADPLASQAKNSAAITMMARMGIYWHETLVQETGCVVFKGSLPLPECCNEIATDVTSMAVPMAFCRGVNEQPVSSENINTAMIRDMAISFVNASVQLQIFDGVMQLTEQRNNG